MTGAIFRVMLLALVRDRGALAMAFIVPTVFFLVFASIFAASSGGDYRPRVAVSIAADAPDVDAFLTALQADDGLTITATARDGEADVRTAVKRGRADVGLAILPSETGQRPRFTVIVDPARDVAAQVLRANVERAFAMAYVIPPSMAVSAAGFSPQVALETVAGGPSGTNEVAYSAGAVALLFLLLSAVHGAVSLFDERDSGVLERIVAGPGGTRPLVDGKFLYLTVLGVAQMAVIFALAWLVYGVDLPASLAPWTVITVAASAAAAGLALTLTTLFNTRQQALTFANVTVLILSALGGSMIPRFLMPPLLRQLGWVTPNAWALEAYTSVFWRGDPWSTLVLPLTLLTAVAGGGLLLARRNIRRLETL
jgi:ABC-2 type transport system permease protein